MELLFSYLDMGEAKSCKRDGYFSRVVSSLLTRRTPDFTRYLQDRCAPAHAGSPWHAANLSQRPGGMRAWTPLPLLRAGAGR